MAEEFNLSVENEVYDISFNEETSEIIVDIQDNVTAINVDFHQGYYPFPNEGSGSSDWNDITNKPSTFPPSAHTHPISEVTNLQTTLDNKVDKVIGKQLSTEDYTTAEKNKLAGIQEGAEVNVNPDWNATSGDAEILNKPTEFPPSLHTHTIADVNNLETALNNKQDKLQNVTGNIGVGKTDASATEKLDVNGNVKATQIKDQYGTLRSQRVITIVGNITLSEIHNGAILHVTNTCNITIPTGLGADFSCDCYVKGAFIATFVNGGVTLNSPSGLLLKTDKMATLYSNASNVFNLLGELATS